MTQHTSKPFSHHPSVKLLAVAALSVAGATAAQAELLSYESFTGYGTAGTELHSSLNPAVTGYTGSWTDIDFGNQEPRIQSGSLFYNGAETGDSVGVPFNTSGGEIAGNGSNSGRVYRLFDASLAVDDTTETTLYMSFLFQSGQETGATTYQTLALYDGTGDANRNFDAGLTTNDGQPGTSYNFGADGAYTSTGIAADTDVHRFVVKFDLSATAASDSVTVWLDPSEETGGTVVSGLDLTWDRLALSDYDGNSASWDEIRWGTTFDDVAVVPEPGTFALLAGLAALSFIALRRRK